MAKEKSIALQIISAMINNKQVAESLDIKYIVSKLVQQMEYGKLSSLGIITAIAKLQITSLYT